MGWAAILLGTLLMLANKTAECLVTEVISSVHSTLTYIIFFLLNLFISKGKIQSSDDVQILGCERYCWNEAYFIGVL